MAPTIHGYPVEFVNLDPSFHGARRSRVGIGPFLADNLRKEITDIVGAVLESASLGRFFQLSVRRSLDDLLLPEDEAAWYLGDLLTRYAAPSDAREGVADRIAEIQRAWAIDGADFDPAREVEIRREIGDYTLFMTGFFWERVEAMSAQHHYARLGSSAYRFVAEHHRALGRPDAAIYRALASDFMRYAVVLMYVRELYAD